MARDARQDRLLRTLGERIAEIRLRRKMTQAALAEAVGVDAQTIQRAEKGKVGLSIIRLQGVANGLGVPLVALFHGVGEDVPEAPWDAVEAQVVAEWRKVPADQQPAALRVLRAFSGGRD